MKVYIYKEKSNSSSLFIANFSLPLQQKERKVMKALAPLLSLKRDLTSKTSNFKGYLESNALKIYM